MIRKVCIVGSGLMGGGIAQVCAQRGIDVSLCDVSEEKLDRAREGIAWSVGKLIDKGKLEGDRDAILSRITPCTGSDCVGDAELVIEAVFENLELKREVFRAIDAEAPDDTLIASNTSAISITELAAATRRADRVLGLHFFSPVPMMQAVEVVRGVQTSDETFAAGIAFVEQLGKTAIPVHKDVPGFLLNRLNLPSSVEAMRLVEDGVGTPEDIDRGVKLAFGRKMGIFETGDMVGLDVTYGALMALYEETKDPRWYPPMILRRKITAGHLGKKTGKGWYDYE